MSFYLFFHLRRTRSVRQQLGRDVSARLISALVLSRLDYCNAVLAGLSAATLPPLQRVLERGSDTRAPDHVTSNLCFVVVVLFLKNNITDHLHRKMKNKNNLIMQQSTTVNAA